MSKVFIIHGSYGNPNENWIPWLRRKLEEEGHTVFVPEFPTPKNQSFNSWWDEFGEYYHHIDEDSILIGHSLGFAFILSIIESLDIPKPMRACYFVSGFTGLLNNPEFDKINKTFTTKEFDWEKIKENCEKFYIFHSDNDPYVPLEKAKELAEKLDVQPVIIKNGGHFNEKAGYTKFKLLYDKIREILK